MKADLKKYKKYTILFNAKEVGSGDFRPIATLFKSGEEAIKLNFDRLFDDRNAALSFALGAAEEAIDAKINGDKPDFTLLVRE